MAEHAEKERVMVFIDGANLYYALKELGWEREIDYEKLGRLLSGERHLVRVYYFGAAASQETSPQKHQRQQEFFDRVRGMDYVTLSLGRLERHGSVFVEKGVDVRIAVEMMRHAYRGTCDTLILVSADSDFVDLVEAVQDLGRHVEVAFPEPKFSWHLGRVPDRRHRLSAEQLAACKWENARSGQ